MSPRRAAMETIGLEYRLLMSSISTNRKKLQLEMISVFLV